MKSPEFDKPHVCYDADTQVFTLKSPGGMVWKLTVDDDGLLTTTELTQ